MLINRNKLYISPKNESLPLPVEENEPIVINLVDNDDSHPITNSLTISSATSPTSTPVATTFNNSSPSSSLTVRSSDQNQSIITNESVILLYNHNVDDFILEIKNQLQLDHKVTGVIIISINNMINVVGEIFDWIEKADNVTLLKKPVISVITKRYVI